ncbi:VCBS repeat-containing protein [Candidatus Woesearchaeota archaeon]|nr:VCBS repeat-containing protein [Candidatus Woesearchaeota archaeon]
MALLQTKFKMIGLAGLVLALVGVETFIAVSGLKSIKTQPAEEKSVPAVNYIAQVPVTYNNAQGVVTGDMNGDGRQDIVVLGSDSSGLTNVYVLLNEGNGNYIFQEKTKPKIEANDITDVTDPGEKRALDKILGGMDGGK